MTTMTTHQAMSHMRTLLRAQGFLTHALLRAQNRDIEAAKKYMSEAFKEMCSVKDELSKVKELTAPISMLHMFYDDLNKLRVDQVEKEILLQDRASHRNVAAPKSSR